MKPEEVKLRNNFDNIKRDLLRCPHCGQLLEEVIVRRLECVIDSYFLNDYGIEFNESIYNDYYDDNSYEYFCGNCDGELDEKFINKLEDEDLFRRF